jgi:tetratricopeptide (TPR) repeat protein
MGDYEKALGVYKEAENYPLNKIAKKYLYDNLGSLYVKLKDYENSIVYRRKRVELTPDAPWGWYNLGVTCHHMKDYDNAIKYEEKALGLMEFGIAKFDLATCYAKKSAVLIEENRDLQEAENCLLRSLKLDPNRTNTYEWLAQCYIKMKNYPKAKEYLDILLDKDPYNEWALKTEEWLKSVMR